ncbi:ABC transporter substrate-binding protein [Bradyrhizobium manausense]|uniref:ABC transporter substrate-binding protein n=1 Tax=Bradyrhizobium TaxID=374 RepID=UPI001BAA20C7|nr:MULTISPECIES: ABC transporter substrate-binding protein [Bradyrhizobium]MBR0831049.1 ABC transporter substrate-binding protein [Bradyrhizobium manausense]UVO30775.1 ABC transporter substrate-binding protein [Bradyrhizobium arachidis]
MGEPMRRRDFLIWSAGALGAWPAVAKAQPSKRQRRIAVVAPGRTIEELKTSSYYLTLYDQLAKHGFVEGQNLVIERYSGAGQLDGYADIARTVVSSNPDAIFTTANPMTLAMKGATRTIPIVTIVGDPLLTGIAASLARPGSNVTGITIDAGIDLHGKRLSLLRETRPDASRLVYLASSSAWKQPQAAAVREAAQLLKLALTHVDLGSIFNGAAYSRTVAQIEAARAELLLVSDEPEHLSNSKALIDVAAGTRLPAMYPFRDLAVAGGLMAYYRDLHDALRQAGDQIAQILDGENPAEMPFRQPTSFKLSINAKTAQEIGVVVPQTLLASADEVIE